MTSSGLFTLIPSANVSDNQFQLSPWQLFNTLSTSADPSIDPNPAELEVIPSPVGSPTSILLHTKGTPAGYSGGLAHNARPYLGQGMNRLGRRFDFRVSAAYMANSPALEFDTDLTTPDGYTRIFGFQFPSDGTIQVWDSVNNVWAYKIDGPGILEPEVWHTVEHVYGYSETGKTGTWEGIVIDGKQYQIPSAQQQVQARIMGNTPWTPGALMQVQPDEIPNGADYTLELDNCSYYWWEA